jgi:tripartite-type tricarboxylate transporter receptor subunit TctC
MEDAAMAAAPHKSRTRRAHAGLSALFLTLSCAGGAQANDASAAFYAGKNLRLTVGSSAGGGTDVVARLLARHIGKHVPGQPGIVVVNQPGGGGLVGANRIANVAARDGTEFATMERAIPQLAIMGDSNVHFDPLALTWLGSLSSYQNDAFMLLVNTDHPARSVDDLRAGKAKARLGASQQGSTNLTFALIARDVLGLDVEPISGYAGTAKISLAMTAREVDGQMMGIVSIQASQRHIWETKAVRPLVQFARRTRHPTLPDVPTGQELVRDEAGRALIEFAEMPFFMAQSFVAPPAIPPERAKALRDAFWKMTQDADYRAEAQKFEIDDSPIDHAAIEALLRKAQATPKPVIEAFRKVVSRSGP